MQATVPGVSALRTFLHRRQMRIELTTQLPHRPGGLTLRTFYVVSPWAAVTKCHRRSGHGHTAGKQLQKNSGRSYSKFLVTFCGISRMSRGGGRYAARKAAARALSPDSSPCGHQGARPARRWRLCLMVGEEATARQSPWKRWARRQRRLSGWTWPASPTGVLPASPLPCIRT